MSTYWDNPFQWHKDRHTDKHAGRQKHHRLLPFGLSLHIIKSPGSIIQRQGRLGGSTAAENCYLFSSPPSIPLSLHFLRPLLCPLCSNSWDLTGSNSSSHRKCLLLLIRRAKSQQECVISVCVCVCVCVFERLEREDRKMYSMGVVLRD